MFVCLFILLHTNLLSQKVRIYEGTIGKEDVVVTLNFLKDKNVFGSFYYKSVGKIINLSGSIKNKVLRITGHMPEGEKPADYWGEEFSGVLHKKEYFGNWSSGASKLVFKLKLTRAFSNWEEVSNSVKVESSNSEGYGVDFALENCFILPKFAQLPVLRDSIVANVLGNFTSSDDNAYALREALAEQCKDELNRFTLISKENAGEVCFCTGNVLVYKTSSFYVYTGSHGFIDVAYYIFNTKTGRRIRLEDIFTHFDNSKLMRTIISKNGFTWYDETYTADSFYLTAKGIGFLFSASGTTHVEGSMDYFFQYKDLPFELRKEFVQELNAKYSGL